MYRAKDPRLGREVAIKVLPASFSQDADRLKRFEQEARAAGVLNHPNITAVHDLGSHEGAPYIVTELLEGETLRSRLSSGSLPVRKAIDYAIQIARGLAAAHEKGIVHRDLKPENLFVTNDGRVKILDFGLAKLKAEKSAGEQTDLQTVSGGTEPGIVLGTMGYMSPEQVRGKVADKRSDLFSFGTILYEMLSGQRAFRGDTAADTITAILTKEPPGPLADEQGRASGHRADRAALPGEEPGGAVRVGTRRRLRPRVAVERFLADGPDRRGGADRRTATLGSLRRSSPRRSPWLPASAPATAPARRRATFRRRPFRS